MRSYGLCLLALLVLPARTFAQTPPDGTGTPEGTGTPAAPQSSASRSAEARAAFAEGMRAYEERRFGDAIVAFRRAGELVPSADLWFNIARSYEELGELDGAIEYYRRYLRDRVDPPDRDRVEEHIRQLEERAEAARLSARSTPTTGTIRIDVDVVGATVAIDDQVVGTSPIALPLSYGAGDHALSVRRDGYVPFRAVVHLDAGSSALAVVRMTPSTGYRAVRGHRRFTWVFASLSAAALATSLGLGIHAVRENRDGNVSNARDFARYSDYAAGGTAVFGLGTVLLYFAEGRSIRTERTGAPTAERYRIDDALTEW